MTPEIPQKKGTRSWQSLDPPLPDWVLEAITAFGFTVPTPVQAACLPLLRKNSDVCVEATTGSGKTLCFLIPVIERILRAEPKRHHVCSIIVSPTRELAAQIHTVLLSLLAFHPESAAILPSLEGDERRPQTSAPAVVPQLVVGGAQKPAEDLSIFMRTSPNVLIATPGRLVELLSSKHVHTPQSSFEMLILDEADRLLDLGFQQDLSKILSNLPKQRRTGLFSASLNDAVGQLSRTGLRNPSKITVRVKNIKTGGEITEEKRTPASLRMTYLVTPSSHKIPSLMRLLEKLEPRPLKTLCFFSTCLAVKYFQKVLPRVLPQDYSLYALHGKLEPNARQKSFASFVSSTSPAVLLATDVAARGLDISGVDLVVQIDPPSDPKVFIHRCGRAGRAGRRGLAVVMLQPGREETYIPFLEIRKTPITPLTSPETAVSADETAVVTDSIRKQALEDREVFQLAQRSFVSWVRSYIEHKTSSIFRVGDLDFEDLARAWGLLTLPKMPELKGTNVDRSLGLDIDLDTIAFKDKAKEKKRQEEIAERAAQSGKEGGRGENDRVVQKRKNEAWSGQREREEVKVARRDKKRRKRDAEKLSQMTDMEKEEQNKLEEMIAQVRQTNEAKRQSEAVEGDFEGFDD